MLISADFSKRIFNAQMVFDIYFQKKAIPWEVYTHNNSQSHMIDEDAVPNKFKGALETPSIISLVEGLLMFVRDSLKVLPDVMIANVIDHVMMPELLIILCQNPDPGIKVSVLKVCFMLSVYSSFTSSSFFFR